MTSDDIKSLQIIATCKDGQHLITTSSDKVLIACVTQWCKFMRLKDDAVAECSLKDFVESINKKK